MRHRSTLSLACFFLGGAAASAEKLPLRPPKGSFESAKRPERKITVTDKRPILVLFEGSDMAGKSSTIRKLLRSLGGPQTIEQAHWGAPTDAEKAEPLLARYLRKLPKDGSIMIWDRSWYGDAVHPMAQGAITKKEMRERILAINEQEVALASKFKIVKIYLDASAERVNETLTKRQTVKKDRLSDADVVAAANHGKVRDLYRIAVNHSDDVVEWKIIDMSDRHKGRDAVVDYIEQQLNPK